MLKIKVLKKMLKEKVLFFVLQLKEVVLLANNESIPLINCYLRIFSFGFQFFVFGSRFSVLVQAAYKFNSLYRASDSLKKQIIYGNTKF